MSDKFFKVQYLRLSISDVLNWNGTAKFKNPSEQSKRRISASRNFQCGRDLLKILSNGSAKREIETTRARLSGSVFFSSKSIYFNELYKVSRFHVLNFESSFHNYISCWVADARLANCSEKINEYRKFGSVEKYVSF